MSLGALFRKAQLADSQVSVMQDYVATAFETVRRIIAPKADLKEIPFNAASGTNVIQHGLGRIPVGWNIIDRNGTATVYRSAWNDSTITLVASANVTIKLEVW